MFQVIFLKSFFLNLLFTVLIFAEATDEVKSVWNQKAQQWEDFVGLNGEKDLNRKYQSDPVLWKFIGSVKNKVVLDAGCGSGYLSSKLAKLGATRVIGLDLSEEMINLANKNYGHENNLEFAVEDLEKLESIPEKSIDLIVSNYVLMDTPDLVAVVKAFKRVLKKDGKIVFAILHPCFPLALRKLDETLKSAVYNWSSSYFEESKMIVAPFSNEFNSDFITFHRTISYYFDVFLKQSFNLINIEEPRIHESLKSSLEPTLYELFRDHPISIIFSFQKKL